VAPFRAAPRFDLNAACRNRHNRSNRHGKTRLIGTVGNFRSTVVITSTDVFDGVLVDGRFASAAPVSRLWAVIAFGATPSGHSVGCQMMTPETRSGNRADRIQRPGRTVVERRLSTGPKLGTAEAKGHVKRPSGGRQGDRIGADRPAS